MFGSTEPGSMDSIRPDNCVSMAWRSEKPEDTSTADEGFFGWLCLLILDTKRAIARDRNEVGARRLCPAFSVGGFLQRLRATLGSHDERARYRFVECMARQCLFPSPDVRLTNEYSHDEARQPPSCYMLAALPIMWIDTEDGVRPAVNPCFNPGSGAGSIDAVLHRVGRLIAPDNPNVAILSLIIASFSPLLLFIGSVVTDDVLIPTLGCIIAWLGTELIARGLRPAPAMLLAPAPGQAFVIRFFVRFGERFVSHSRRDE